MTTPEHLTLPPTERQVTYLRRLVERHHAPDAWPVMLDGLRRTGRWDRASVSGIIDQLLDADADPSRVEPNRYAGPCGACGEPVLTGEGRAERVAGRWSAFCAECPTTAPGHPPLGYHLDPASGRTVEVCVSKGGRTFYRVLSTERGWETDLSVAWSERLGDGTLLGLDDARRIGAETGRCALCGRELKRAESIREGIGPDCAARLAAANA